MPAFREGRVVAAERTYTPISVHPGPSDYVKASTPGFPPCAVVKCRLAPRAAPEVRRVSGRSATYAARAGRVSSKRAGADREQQAFRTPSERAYLVESRVLLVIAAKSSPFSGPPGASGYRAGSYSSPISF